jgi:hypothetical protein
MADTKVSLADKNNNPGNLKAFPITANSPHSQSKWRGSTGENAGFTTFDTAESGVRAAALNLYTSQEKHGNNTVTDIITRWAPPGDNNDTAAYIDDVATDLGVSPTADLGSLRNNAELTAKLVKAIAKHEGATVGEDGKYTDKVIASGVTAASGKEIQVDKQETDFEPEKFGAEVDVDQGFTKDPDYTRGTGIVEDIVSPNWLSTIDSPAYRWTLYIVNNEIWNDPTLLAIDDAALNTEKAKIIAKQGVTTEFTLDNFAAMSVITPGQKHGNTTPGIIQFDLFETLGFTFLDKCLKAGIAIGKPANLYSQNYMLKLEFLGRDFVTGGSTVFPGVFFYPVRLNQIRSETGPEGTRYNILAWSSIKHAQTESTTDTDITIKNITTVGDFAKGLETVYNNGQIEAMNPSDFGKAKVPPKQIEIVFDQGTDVISAKGTITGKLNSFNLEAQTWGSINDSSTATVESATPHDTATRWLTIDRETSLPMTIAQLIQKNVPGWATWTAEAAEVGITPYIVVDPTIKYRLRTPGSKEHKYANVEPIKIILTIKIGLSNATAPLSIKDHTEKLADAKWQKERINILPIEKAYTHMYSGTNTEVLNYGIEIQQLYVVADQPSAGMYMHGKGSEGEPQFGTTELPLSVTAEKSPYIEDIPYTGMSVYNDLVHGGYTKTLSAEDTQRNENSIDTRSTFAHMANELAKREHDAIEMNLEIKGDPYWMGNMQAIIIGGKIKIPDYSKRDGLISFVQWNPNVDKLLTEQIKGQLDVISSGVYKLTSIESKFQGGKFTQTLKGYKDVTTNTALVLGRLIELSGGM